MEKQQMIIGVDGGGSKSVGVAVTMDGTLLAVSRGSGINYNALGMDRARENLASLIQSLKSECHGEVQLLSVGMPALDTTADRETIRRFAGSAFQPEKLLMESDAYMALVGMCQGQPGMIVICGTGSMAVLADETGRQTITGGWGYLLGDPGSGYDIALNGLRACIRAWEKTGPDTLLTEKTERHFELTDPRELIQRVYNEKCGPDTLARFAPTVLEAAAEGDGEALRVVRLSLGEMAAEAAELLKTTPTVENVGLYGGIFQHHALARALFTQALRERLNDRPFQIVEPELPPELGAVIHGMKKLGLLNETILKNIKASYYEWLDGQRGMNAL